MGGRGVGGERSPVQRSQEVTDERREEEGAAGPRETRVRCVNGVPDRPSAAPAPPPVVFGRTSPQRRPFRPAGCPMGGNGCLVPTGRMGAGRTVTRTPVGSFVGSRQMAGASTPHQRRPRGQEGERERGRDRGAAATPRAFAGHAYPVGSGTLPEAAYLLHFSILETVARIVPDEGPHQIDAREQQEMETHPTGQAGSQNPGMMRTAERDVSPLTSRSGVPSSERSMNTSDDPKVPSIISPGATTSTGPGS